MRILIADNDEKTRSALSDVLTAQGFETVTAKDGTEVLSRAEKEKLDGIVMDIMLPGTDGLSVLHTLRKNGDQVPVMLLTGLSGVNDCVAGLDAGADAYVAKPYVTREVLARIRAMVRRPCLSTGNIQAGNLHLDVSTRMLLCGDRALPLSCLEFGLMELLMRNPGVRFTSGMILDRVWGMDSNAGTNSVWVYISYLRRKLKVLEADVQIISIRGLGYTLKRK